jgi:peptidoglycan/LPS O-acetylase OafA/YrhL
MSDKRLASLKSGNQRGSILSAVASNTEITKPRGEKRLSRSAHAGHAGEVGSYSVYVATRPFASLDGLRALSIAGVLWFHTTTDLPIWPALRRGFLGVDFFFIISGFLIVTLLLRERRNTGTISLGNFYVRRSLRIFPAYWAMLLFVACVAYLKPGHESEGIKHDLPYSLLYISNLVPMASLLSITWSLSTEEQFYSIIPALQKYTPRLFPMAILPVAYVMVSLPPFGIFQNINLPGFFRQTTFGPILLGVMLAFVLDHPRGWAVTASILRSPLSPLFALALVVLALSCPGPDISGWPRLAIHGSLLVLLASCVVREKHALLPVLSWGPIRRFGVVSYGIYLYHLVVYWPAAKLLALLGVQSQIALFLLVAAFSWLAAEFSYRFFEQRFLMLKRQFSSAGETQFHPTDPTVAVAAAMLAQTSRDALGPPRTGARQTTPTQP